MRKRKTLNYRSVSIPATYHRHLDMLAWLELEPGGMSLEELADAVDMSRQLALYHVKKLAAAGQIKAELEPTDRNGGVRFRIWTPAHHERRARGRVAA